MNRLVAGIALILTLSACGSQSKPASTASVAASTAAASAASSTSTASVAASTSTTSVESSTAAPVKGEKPTREFVIGKWGTNGDCTLAIDLRPDGTSDGPFGNWTYSDGVIGFADEPDFKVRVTVLDDTTMESTNDSSDKTSRMTRCP